MRTLRVFASYFLLIFLLLISASFAANQTTKVANLTVKVIDPQSALVASARVSLYKHGESEPLAVRSADARGAVEFRDLAEGSYDLRILAPGFAPALEHIELSQDTIRTMQLRLAAAGQTVTVTAAATPATAAETASQVSLIGAMELKNLQPTEMGESLRFAPGVNVSATGTTGNLTSLFVRGGNSDYNKVIIDGVPVNDPGGSFDFGTVSPAQFDRIELLRGAESTLYGSDAMTSTVQVFSRNGTTRTPLAEMGADGGNFGSARGYGSFSGVAGAFDYNLFGDQFNTNGQGVNDEFSNSTQGANLGYTFSPRVHLRLRLRHNTSRVGNQGEWQFSQGGMLPPGDYNLPPDSNLFSRQNNFLASTELSIATGSRWIHHFSGYEYNHKRLDQQNVPLDPARVSAYGFPIDYVDYDAQWNPIPSKTWANYNRAGFNYQGEYWARNWARTIFGYEFEDENGFYGDINYGGINAGQMNHGLRLNHAAYGQELLNWRRFSLQAGARFVHNDNFGNRGIPRVALSYLAIKGGDFFSGTRLRGSYSTGIKEAPFEDVFGLPAFGVIGNPNLKPEQNRAFDAGITQSFKGGKYSLDATYFNNHFSDQIQWNSIQPGTPAYVSTCVPLGMLYCSDFINLNKAMAHGVEMVVHARPTAHLQLQGGYVYDSTQILLAPQTTDPMLAAGKPLLRRPKHSGNLLASYTQRKFGVSLGGTFVGERPDEDFSVLPVPLTRVAGYARVDLGAWYAIKRYVTAYVAIQNLLNQHYEDALGYPGTRTAFRAGMRYYIGGEGHTPTL